MKKRKATRARSIRLWLPATATALLQAVIQQTYAAPCSMDNSIQLTANSETCTATLTEYEGNNSLTSTVLITGSNSNLTLLNNTTVNVPGGVSPKGILVTGNNNTLNTGNLTINYNTATLQHCNTSKLVRNIY